MRQLLVIASFFLLVGFALTGVASAKLININARSAMLVDMKTGQVLYEQNPDVPIAPASITKVLTLYLVFEAIREGKLHLWDNVKVSAQAAGTGGSRMGLRTGDVVPVGELIKGMAVVSGNDACVAIAEHMSGSVDAFVRRMNAKARQLGMNSSTFLTPHGLPAKGQLTTARDIAKLSVAYLRRYPESLNIHSMESYTYRNTTRRNANRLLGTCEGVDGLKTGFVCAAGYNLTATAVRGDSRLVAVVLGAPSPGVRAAETARLLELGYESVNTGTVLTCAVDSSTAGRSTRESSPRTVTGSSGKFKNRTRTAAAETTTGVSAKVKAARSRSPKSVGSAVGSDSGGSTPSSSKSGAAVAGQKVDSPKTTRNESPPLRSDGKDARNATAKAQPAARTQEAAPALEKSSGKRTSHRTTVSKADGATGDAASLKTSSRGAEKSTSTRDSKSSPPPPSTGKSKSPRTPPAKTAEIAKPRS